MAFGEISNRTIVLEIQNGPVALRAFEKQRVTFSGFPPDFAHEDRSSIDCLVTLTLVQP